MTLRSALFATLLVAAPVLASDPPATAAPRDVADAPVIQIERGDATVSEAWRSDGVDFATYGPDGKPVVPTPEQQATQAVTNAYDVMFVALGAAETGCAAGRCVGGRAGRGRAAADTVASNRLARDVVAGWLRDATPDAKGLGDADVRHGLTWTSDGHAWELLLCGCGRYALRRDGADVGGGTGTPTGVAEIDALLVDAAAPAAD